MVVSLVSFFSCCVHDNPAIFCNDFHFLLHINKNQRALICLQRSTHLVCTYKCFFSCSLQVLYTTTPKCLQCFYTDLAYIESQCRFCRIQVKIFEFFLLTIPSQFCWLWISCSFIQRNNSFNSYWQSQRRDFLNMISHGKKKR